MNYHVRIIIIIIPTNYMQEHHEKPKPNHIHNTKETTERK